MSTISCFVLQMRRATSHSVVIVSKLRHDIPPKDWKSDDLKRTIRYFGDALTADDIDQISENTLEERYNKKPNKLKICVVLFHASLSLVIKIHFHETCKGFDALSVKKNLSDFQFV